MKEAVAYHDVSIARVRSPLSHIGVFRFLFIDVDERRKARVGTKVENIEGSFELVGVGLAEKIGDARATLALKDCPN